MRSGAFEIAITPENGSLSTKIRKSAHDADNAKRDRKIKTVALSPASKLKLANMMMSQNAFVQLAAQFFDELKRNSTRLPLVEKLDLPVKVIWGEHDPYLGVAMGRERAAHFKKSSFHVLPAGHWLQCDMPKQLADLMLS